MKNSAGRGLFSARGKRRSIGRKRWVLGEATGAWGVAGRPGTAERAEVRSPGRYACDSGGSREKPRSAVQSACTLSRKAYRRDAGVTNQRARRHFPFDKLLQPFVMVKPLASEVQARTTPPPIQRGETVRERRWRLENPTPGHDAQELVHAWPRDVAQGVPDPASSTSAFTAAACEGTSPRCA